MPAKVLIVDDEKDFLDIMAERMGARGVEVSTTTSAENALKMVLKESYDAVIMDLMMPEMDGFKALKLFKETRPDLPIILLTANVPEEKCIEAIKLGAMDVIEKPADLNLLTQKIEEAKALKVNAIHAEHEALSTNSPGRGRRISRFGHLFPWLCCYLPRTRNKSFVRLPQSAQARVYSRELPAWQFTQAPWLPAREFPPENQRWGRPPEIQ